MPGVSKHSKDMAKPKQKLKFTITPLKVDLETCDPATILLTQIKIDGIVSHDMAMEIARSVEVIMKKYGKTTEQQTER